MTSKIACQNASQRITDIIPKHHKHGNQAPPQNGNQAPQTWKPSNPTQNGNQTSTPKWKPSTQPKMYPCNMGSLVARDPCYKGPLLQGGPVSRDPCYNAPLLQWTHVTMHPCNIGSLVTMDPCYRGHLLHGTTCNK